MFLLRSYNSFILQSGPTLQLPVLLFVLTLGLPVFSFAEGSFVIVPVAAQGNKEVVVNGISTFLKTVQRKANSDRNVQDSAVSELVMATCWSNEVLVGGSCSAVTVDSNSSTTNYGVVWDCTLVENTVIAVSYANGLLYSSSKYGPPVSATAICAFQPSLGHTAVKDKTELSPKVQKAREVMEGKIAHLLESMR